MAEFRRLTYKTPDGAWGIKGVSLLSCPARLYGAAAKLCDMESLCEDVFRAKDAELTLDALQELVDRNTCAVMLELIQGEGGVMPLDKDYLQSLEKICRERDILLICDEVQTGNGRSGKLYSYMNYGIFPDIVSTAKGLAGGLPLGATLFSEKTKDVLTPGSHGSTFGGNPICCAGAINILSRLDEKTLAGVRKRSEYIFSELSGAPGIKEVSGLGLMIGIKTERDASEVINACIKKGVLVIKAKDKVRLLPALNIPMELLEQAVGVIKEVCADKEA